MTHNPLSSPKASTGLGIRGKIVPPLVAVAIMSAILGVSLIHRLQSHQRDRQLADRVTAIGHALAHVAETANDERHLQRFVSAIGSEPGVEMVIIAAGKPLQVIASTCEDWRGLPVSQLPDPRHTRDDLERALTHDGPRLDLYHDSNDTIDYTMPLRTRLRPQQALRWTPGALMIHVDGRAIRREQYADTAFLILTVLGTIGLASLVTYSLLWSIVLKPVDALGQVVQAIAFGRQSARVPITSQDELGQLATSVNEMLDELADRERLEREATQRALEAQHQAETALASLSRHKFALDQHSIVAVTDSDGIITYANDRFCEISKYRREELIGSTHSIVNSGYHPKEFWERLWRTISQGEVWHGEVRNRAKDGTNYWVDTTIVPFKDPDGHIQQYVSIRTDITQRKRAEATLMEREQQLRTLINNIPGVSYRCLLDDAWTMLFISEAVQDLTGYPARDFLQNSQRTYDSVIHPDDREMVSQRVRQAVAGRRSFEIEYRVVRADGQIRHVWERGQAIYQSEPPHAVRYLDGAILDNSARKHAEQQLAEERARLVAFVEHAPAAIAMLDQECRFVAVSQRWMADHGLMAEAIVGRPFAEVFPAAAAIWRPIHERCLQGAVECGDNDTRQLRDTSDHRYLKWEVRPWHSVDGKIGGIMMFTEDITSIKQAEAALLESKEQFELAVNGSNDGIWDWNLVTRRIFLSPRFRQLLGYGPDELLDSGGAVRRLLHPEDARNTLQILRRHLQSAIPFDVVHRLRTRSGEYRWFRTRGEVVRDNSGKARRMAGSTSDITALKRIEEESTRAALLDKLTGLPNRALLLDRLQQTMYQAFRSGRHQYVVMFLDFDRFKIVNDSLGHDAGDALLKEIASRLKIELRSADSVSRQVTGPTTARLGGDEFVVLLDDLQNHHDALQIADRLLTCLSRPYRIGKHDVYSTASIGIVFGDIKYSRAEDIVRDADTAMYEAKRTGKARYVVFDASMRERVRRRMMLEGDLRKALTDGQLYLVYQPIVSLTTGETIAIEALVRWNHHVEGTISPSEFIPLAEESGLIACIGEWILRQGCYQMTAWQKLLGNAAPAQLSFNLSRRQFSMPDLPQVLSDILAETHLAPQRLLLEVTEDAFAGDFRGAAKIIQNLKQVGVQLAIDDFGSSSSSFAALRELPLDVLKTDKSLIVGVDHSKDVAALVHALSVLVKNLGITMISQGIESASQVVTLQKLGCAHGQGFFFTEPLLPHELEMFVRKNRACQRNATGAALFQNPWSDELTIFPAMNTATGNP